MKNSVKGRGKPNTSLKAIRVYANPEQSKLIHDAAQKDGISDSSFCLQACLRQARRVLRNGGSK